MPRIFRFPDIHICELVLTYPTLFTSFTGKGTSAKDGSSLSGALLEHLDSRGISGIFATHLHELFLLPLTLHTVAEKKMGYCLDEAGGCFCCTLQS